MNLHDYIDAVNEFCLSITGNLSKRVCGVRNDSRKVSKRDVFVAIRGTELDGTKFIESALKKEASAIFYETLPGNLILDDFPDVTFIKIVEKSGYSVFARLCEVFHDFPAKKMCSIGITGTNGKTTSAFMLNYLFRSFGQKTGMIGTVVYEINGQKIEAARTTPPPDEVQEIIAQMREEKVDTLIMEISSHSAFQNRTGSMRFNCAVFTNLSGDHLDYHQSMENYYQAKKKLFTRDLAPDGIAVVNIDDEYGRRLAKELDSKILTYGFSENADLRILEFSGTSEGSLYKLQYKEKAYQDESPLFGKFNIYNLAGVVGALVATTDKSLKEILRMIKNFTGVPGRLQSIKKINGGLIFIDYAHTDDALDNVCSALNELEHENIIVIFGCGGDRDKTKRPRMAEAASRYTDFLIVTLDNSRFENPDDIINDIKLGIPTNQKHRIIADREKAIAAGVQKLGPKDILLIAGKGHETYQDVKGVKTPFDDYKIASKYAEK
ncbi:MAG: UDP-N-acetylmuramoyl-L-alanyl-D-glutamate--2,6-diaminopimelate ligase [Verrucomicrobiota bacterium]|nr:UDP-N-acetylmuramoyl-L-alanyl-D-glutamate--2,6-diaminopimelate ligase [Verrucomicrobiota bacterium]